MSWAVLYKENYITQNPCCASCAELSIPLMSRWGMQCSIATSVPAEERYSGRPGINILRISETGAACWQHGRPEGKQKPLLWRNDHWYASDEKQ